MQTLIQGLAQGECSPALLTAGSHDTVFVSWVSSRPAHTRRLLNADWVCPVGGFVSRMMEKRVAQSWVRFAPLCGS
jgi:hypothetical protein